MRLPQTLVAASVTFQVSIVITMVPNDAVLKKVVGDATDGIVSAMQKDAVHVRRYPISGARAGVIATLQISCSTVHPDTARELAALHTQHGSSYVGLTAPPFPSRPRPRPAVADRARRASMHAHTHRASVCICRRADLRARRRGGTAGRLICRRPLPRFALGLGSPLPHPRHDWAHPSHICTGTGFTPPTVCTGTGLTPPTSAP